MFVISILKFLQGYVLVHLSGYAPERFLNMCGKHNILIWNLETCEDGYRFCISAKGYKLLKPILKKTRTHVRILQKKGAPFYLFRYRKRKMFVLGIVSCCFILFYTSRFIWNVEINGNSYLSDETILDFLETKNADFGTKIAAIDCAALEEQLRSAYPEVIWTSIKIYGTKLTVDIQESLLPEQSYMTGQEEICDIVAAKDGIITYMITRQGIPVAKTGTEVKQGDILVSGEIVVYNDFGEAAAYLYEKADADVKARVSYYYEEVIARNYEKKVFKETPITTYGLQIGDFTIKNPFQKEPNVFFEEAVENIQLCFGENFYFPLFFKKISYFPYEIEQKEYTETEVKALAEEHFLLYLQNLEEKGIHIIEKNVMIKKVNQNYLVSGTITAEESIVMYQPTEIRSIENVKGQIEDEFN